VFTGNGAGKLVGLRRDPDAIQGLEILGHYAVNPEGYGISTSRIHIAGTSADTRTPIRGLRVNTTHTGYADSSTSAIQSVFGSDDWPVCESDIRMHFVNPPAIAVQNA